MKRIIIGAALFLGALAAFAAGSSATVSWTLATADVHGTVLDAGAVKATRVVWRRHGQTAITGTLDVPAPATSVVVANLDCSQFDFSAQTVVTGDTSDETVPGIVFDTGVACKPNPPGALAVH